MTNLDNYICYTLVEDEKKKQKHKENLQRAAARFRQHDRNLSWDECLQVFRECGVHNPTPADISYVNTLI